MDTNENPVTELTEEQSWEHLGTHELGRLVTSFAGVIDIFPVNYVVDRGEIVFRTAEGNKLFELTANDEVLFEVDDYTRAEAWSVVIRGTARRLETDDEVLHADSLGLRPWIPTLKHNYVAVTPHHISGRSFHRGEEPDRYGVQPY